MLQYLNLTIPLKWTENAKQFSFFFHAFSLIHMSYYGASQILINAGCVTAVDFFSRFFPRTELQERERSGGESVAIKLRNRQFT